MPHTANPVTEHARKRQIRLERRQAMGHGTKGLRHRRTINHRQHRHAKVPGQIGCRRRAIEQAHHPFNQNQVGVTRRLPEQTTALGFTDHPQVELIHRRTAGASKNHRVKKIRAALEHPHALALACMQARQGCGDRGFTLTGGRCSDQ